MMSGLKQRQVVRVLFDETHSESWTIDPDQAARINPDYPENSSYATAADTLAKRDFVLSRHTEGPLNAVALTDEADPKKWIALVHDDEFPLGNFHVNLQKKLMQAVA